MSGRIDVLNRVIVDIRVAVEFLRIARPVAALPPHLARRCIARGHRQRAAARNNCIRANEAANRRVIIPRIIEQQILEG